jgi:hypothetical protein
MGFRKNREEAEYSIPPELLRPNPYAPVANNSTFDYRLKEEDTVVTTSTEGTSPSISGSLILTKTYQSAEERSSKQSSKQDDQSSMTTTTDELAKEIMAGNEPVLAAKKPRNALVERPNANTKLEATNKNSAPKKAKKAKKPETKPDE